MIHLWKKVVAQIFKSFVASYLSSAVKIANFKYRCYVTTVVHVGEIINMVMQYH